jgi:hypothetical protein
MAGPFGVNAMGNPVQNAPVQQVPSGSPFGAVGQASTSPFGAAAQQAVKPSQSPFGAVANNQGLPVPGQMAQGAVQDAQQVLSKEELDGMLNE